MRYPSRRSTYVPWNQRFEFVITFSSDNIPASIRMEEFETWESGIGMGILEVPEAVRSAHSKLWKLICV